MQNGKKHIDLQITKCHIYMVISCLNKENYA